MRNRRKPSFRSFTHAFIVHSPSNNPRTHRSFTLFPPSFQPSLHEKKGHAVSSKHLATMHAFEIVSFSFVIVIVSCGVPQRTTPPWVDLGYQAEYARPYVPGTPIRLDLGGQVFQDYFFERSGPNRGKHFNFIF